jgi:hypothetical protein
MNGRYRLLGKYVAVALIAVAGLAIEAAPTLVVPARDRCAALAETIAMSSCAVVAYGDAQHIGGTPVRADAGDSACATLIVL